MVARSASQAGGFSPVDTPRVSIAADGTLAAVQEASHVTVVELPGGAAFAEIGVDPAATVSEVAWLGVTPRLLVLSRYATYSTAHLLDPYGPRSISEIRLESPMRLFATVGPYALVVGMHSGAAVLGATETHLTPYQFPARTLPLAAGSAAGQFVVALPGSIEEWDPQSRMPKRRLRLPRPAAITAVGGSERVVWMTTLQEPARIDVIALVNRGQPKAHDLPEPIARIAGHPRSDLVVCVGADSGRLYVVDLDGRTRLRVCGPEDLAHVESVGLVIGRMTGVVAARAGQPLAILPLDGRELDGEVGAPQVAGDGARGGSTLRSTLTGETGTDDEPVAWSEPAAADDPPAPREVALPAPQPAPASSLFRPPSPPVPTPRPGAPALARPAPSTSERFAAWRELVRQDQPRVDPLAAARRPAQRGELRPAWRDEIVAWTCAVTAGAMDHNAPHAPVVDAVIARFELAPQLHPVVVLLYGAHLCGELGAAPIDVARLLDRQWNEALGRGELAARKVARYAGSRVALAPGLLRVLDELPPTTGVLVGEPGAVALLGPCVVVADDGPLTAVAERYHARVGGAILAAHDQIDRGELLFEARAYGAAAMLRANPDGALDEPAIFVVSDAAHAERLNVPRLE